ncbi:MAG: SDR family NAD(P)-dependent oxidoreductase [Bacteroidota bacterium]
MNSINKSYTLITGASEGLGKALAIECASRGMNLILVALPGIELHQLSSYIRREYKVLVYEFGLNLTIEESRHFLWEKVMENNLPCHYAH